MKRTIALGLACSLLFVGGCKSSGYREAEEIMEEMLQCFSDLHDAYASVKDPATAKVAAGKVNEVCDRLEQLGARAAKVKVRKKEDKELEEKFKPKLQEMQQKMEKVAFQAGVNSQGEQSFVDANMRLARVGQSMMALGAR